MCNELFDVMCVKVIEVVIPLVVLLPPYVELCPHPLCRGLCVVHDVGLQVVDGLHLRAIERLIFYSEVAVFVEVG